MTKRIKVITFDLDDTLWDNRPVITKAETDTRRWLENKAGNIDWGSFEDFLDLRKDLIKKDPAIRWDISKLRKEIFKIKIKHIDSVKKRENLADQAFKIFMEKRHEINLYPGVKKCLSSLSKKYILGVLTNGNADIYKFEFGKYFSFSISSLEAKNNKPNRAHFDKAVELVGDITFNEMLHIGDHQINDIFAAHQLGISALWFNNIDAEWVQNFKKPDEFDDWSKLQKIIEDKYE